jgi:CheY-like chemotaxis protein
MSGEVAALEGRHILIVEDDYLVAQVLVDLLEDAGAEVLGPIGWVNEAISFIENNAESFDGVILDINLHGEKSYPVADALSARSLGFVFATGYCASVIEPKYKHHPRCRKPFSRPVLITALAEAA